MLGVGEFICSQVAWQTFWIRVAPCSRERALNIALKAVVLRIQKESQSHCSTSMWRMEGKSSSVKTVG